jgi:Mn2+/Fe2+ NRAMP family transporter
MGIAPNAERSVMKSILIAATVVGAAVAGLILYMQQTGKDLQRNFKEAVGGY